MIYQMNILRQLSDRQAIKAGLKEGAIPITITINENNHKMLRYFQRAARLAKVEITIEGLDFEPSIEESQRLVVGP